AAPLRSAAPTAPPGALAGGVFETLLTVDGVPVRLADHVARLDRSCWELYGRGLPDGVAGRITDAAKAVPLSRGARRVVVSHSPGAARPGSRRGPADRAAVFHGAGTSDSTGVLDEQPQRGRPRPFGGRSVVTAPRRPRRAVRRATPGWRCDRSLGRLTTDDDS